MNPFIYNLSQHFNAADRRLLIQRAEEEGCTEEEFIERTMKRKIFKVEEPLAKTCPGPKQKALNKA